MRKWLLLSLILFCATPIGRAAWIGSLDNDTSGGGTASDVSCSDCVALTTETTGNYVQSVATTAPITGGAVGSEGATLTLALTQNAGTDITADLEEETHASEHNVGGGDEVAYYGFVQDEGSDLTQRRRLNFAGTGVTCADDTTRTTCTIPGSGTATITLEEGDVIVDASTTNLDFGLGFDLTSSPAGEVNIVLDYTEDNPILGTETAGDYVASITAGAGLASTGATSGETISHTLSTASNEADFLSSGALTCGAGTQGKAQVHTTPFQYCDNAATPALQYAAYGDSTGQALAGDSATAFFTTGTLEDARLSTNVIVAGDTFSSDVTGTLEADGDTPLTIAANSVALTTDTTGNYVASITNGTSITGGDGGGEGSALTLDVADDSINGTELTDNITVDGTGQRFGDGTTNYTQFGTNGALTYVGTSKPARTIILTATGAILPGTNFPASTTFDGTNVDYKVLDFDDTVDESIYYTFIWPDSCDAGTITASFRWQSTATTGDVVWAIQTACVADGEAMDATLNTANTVTDTAKGTANQRNDADIASVTVTGCAAGELVHVKIYRDADNGSDTMTGDARYIYNKLEYQANAESD